MNDTLTKPFSGRDLLARLQAAAALIPPTAESSLADPAAEAGPVPGMSELIDRLGDAATLQAVGPALLEHTPDLLTRLRRAVADQDPSATRLAHTLRGSTSLFGGVQTTEILRGIESATREARWDEAAEGLDVLQPPLEQLIDLVRRSLISLQNNG